MKATFNFKVLLSLFISFYALSSCEKKFDYGKSQNALKTIEAADISQTTATVAGTVITDNGATISARGICYGLDNKPLLSGLKKRVPSAMLGDFSCLLDSLSPGVIYYARAYATNSYGTAYGNVVSFTTQAATIPIVSSTTAANLITSTSAGSGGNITNSGASNVTKRGVCWSSTVAIPTIFDSATKDGSGAGIFASSLTGLATNTRYYIRAYATNTIGTGYGDVKTFTTTSATIPTGITTTILSAVTQTTASGGGSTAGDGGSAITARGICWSNSTSSPTIINTKTSNGAGTGGFSSSLTGLLPGTTYYVRAYATNSVGTAYGTTMVFTTISATAPVGITTNGITSILQTSASCGGSITGDGGAAITSRGICWSNTTSSPSISNSRTVDGAGIGSFSSSLTGLLPNTTYYVRAYATNSVGTAYGTTMVFTTISATVPVGITTNGITSILQTSASCGGSITGDGGTAITSRGVCWSNTTSSPSISNSRTIEGAGIGSFSSSLTGLLPNTTYYVRAYATNSAGTAYASVVAFTTLPNLAIGASYQGGIIAYIFIPGDAGYVSGETHGLIATTANQSTGSEWGCYGTSISGTSTVLGKGLTNTKSIVGTCLTTGIAASICNNLSSGGYTDWYLPSLDELNKLYLNRNAIGGFSSYYYWSSSQASSGTSWTIYFSNGSSNSSYLKTNLFYVRAVRTF